MYVRRARFWGRLNLSVGCPATSILSQSPYSAKTPTQTVSIAATNPSRPDMAAELVLTGQSVLVQVCRCVCPAILVVVMIQRSCGCLCGSGSSIPTRFMTLTEK